MEQASSQLEQMKREGLQEIGFTEIVKLRDVSVKDLARAALFLTLGKKRDEERTIVKNKKGDIFFETTRGDESILETPNRQTVRITEKKSDGGVRIKTNFHEGDPTKAGMISDRDGQGKEIYQEETSWGDKREIKTKRWFKDGAQIGIEELDAEEGEFGSVMKTNRYKVVEGQLNKVYTATDIFDQKSNPIRHQSNDISAQLWTLIENSYRDGARVKTVTTKDFYGDDSPLMREVEELTYDLGNEKVQARTTQKIFRQVHPQHRDWDKSSIETEKDGIVLIWDGWRDQKGNFIKIGEVRKDLVKKTLTTTFFNEQGNIIGESLTRPMV